MCALFIVCRDVAVLSVQPGGVQLKHLKRVDLDGTRISIGVQQGPVNGPLMTTTRHLLCMRRVLQVGRWHTYPVSMGWPGPALCLMPTTLCRT